MRSKTILIAMAIVSLCGCSKDAPSPSAHGTLKINVERDSDIILKTKSGSTDVQTYILEITQGASVQQRFAPIGSSSKSVILNTGSYTVKVISDENKTPAFDSPVYGETENITIVKDQQKDLSMICSQQNAGISIDYTSKFKSAYTEYYASVSTSDGFLNYVDVNASKRGYFFPAEATITVVADGEVFENKVILKPKYNYNITIDQETSTGESGSLALVITLSTEVTTENIIFVKPAE